MTKKEIKNLVGRPYFIDTYRKKNSEGLLDTGYQIASIDMLGGGSYEWDLIEIWYFPKVSEKNLYIWSGTGCSCNSPHEYTYTNSIDEFSVCEKLEDVFINMPAEILNDDEPSSWSRRESILENREYFKGVVKELQEFFDSEC